MQTVSTGVHPRSCSRHAKEKEERMCYAYSQRLTCCRQQEDLHPSSMHGGNGASYTGPKGSLYHLTQYWFGSAAIDQPHRTMGDLHDQPHSILSTLRLAVFVPWLIIAWLAFMVYGRNTLVMRNKYYLRVRFPSLVLADLLQSLFTTTTVCLHEIFTALGWHLPCTVSNLATVLTPTNYLAIFLVRALQLIVIFDPGFRKRFYPYLASFKSWILFACIVLAILLTIVMAVSPIPFCHDKNICMGHSCPWGASYYLVFGLVGTFHFVLIPMLRHMMTLNIQEKIGYSVEFRRILTMSVVLNVVIFASLVLVDWGVLSARWHFLTDLTLCTAFSANFFIGHVFPADAHDYTPRTIRRFRRRLRRFWGLFSRHKTNYQVSPLAKDNAVAIPPAAASDPEGGDKPKVVKEKSAVPKLTARTSLKKLKDLGGSVKEMMGFATDSDQSAPPASPSSGAEGESIKAIDNTEHLSLDEILESEPLRVAFLSHCRNHFGEENVFFLLDTLDIVAYDTTAGAANALSLDPSRLAWVCETYLRLDGLYPLRLRRTAYKSVARTLKWGKTSRKSGRDHVPPSLAEGVSTTDVVWLLKQVAREVERSVVENFLKDFRRTDEVYLEQLPLILAASTPEQVRKREIARKREKVMASGKSKGRVEQVAADIEAGSPEPVVAPPLQQQQQDGSS